MQPPAWYDIEHELPPWYIAQHMWRERIMTWMDLLAQTLPVQPIHGDMHWANIVPAGCGFGFIDFDKVMWAPPVFDLAKLIATGCFELGTKARFQRQRVARLVEGYASVRTLSHNEASALEGLALLLNEETARIGMAYDVDGYRVQADTVASWWITRRRRQGADPLGIRSLLAPAPAEPAEDQQQLLLWPEPDAPLFPDRG
jgi:Ser/Thr protein kinase RdoA (MazF antagonist)